MAGEIPTRRTIRPASRRPARGAALVVVMVALALLSALAVDLAYESRVRLQIAANARDELRATYLAKSAVNLSRLVLAFQAQIDDAMGKAGALIPQAAPVVPTATTKGGPGLGRSEAQGGASAGSAMPRPQIWSMVPINSALVGALFEPTGEATHRPPGAAAPAAAEGANPTLPYGDFDGGFTAKIEDEGTKVNVQLGSLQTAGQLGARVEALLRLTCDQRWDSLFDREDENGQRYTRTDLPIHLRDFVDDNNVTSSLKASFPSGNCSFIVPTQPFEDGFGDENFPYDRGPDRYRAKNDRFDSVEELHLVAGVTDLVYAAFGDRFTVYLPDDAAINVNANDALEQLRIAGLMADAASLPIVATPEFPEKLHKALSDIRMNNLFTITPQQFAAVLQALGVVVKPEYLNAGPKNPFTDRSLAFRIHATGAAGAVSKDLDAVITFDPRQLNAPVAGQPAIAGQANPGRLIHWRED